MIYLLFSWGIILDGIIFTTQHKLTAVSNGTIAETLYRRAKDEEPHVHKTPELQIEAKNQLCHQITNSGLFLNRWKEKPAPILKMKTKLEKDYPDIFKSLFVTIKDKTININRIAEVKHVKKDEKSERSFTEYVFRCLTTKDPEFADQKREELYVYYISSQYNFGDTRNPYIPGRFIFAYTDTTKKDRMIPQAVAEAPAQLLLSQGQKLVDWYLQWKKTHKSEPKSDTTCELNTAQRSRVCSLLLNSEYFDQEITFTSSDGNVGEGCVERTISFLSPGSEEEKSYTEKMITCKADVINAHYQKEIYFSRVYGHTCKDMAFVYRPATDSKVVLDGLFDNVRYVI